MEPWTKQPDRNADPEVEHPRHYNAGKIECIDAITAAVSELKNGTVAYCLGNVIKYVFRHAYKGQPRRDLEKARWYLERAISQYEKE